MKLKLRLLLDFPQTLLVEGHSTKIARDSTDNLSAALHLYHVFFLLPKSNNTLLIKNWSINFNGC